MHNRGRRHMNHRHHESFQGNWFLVQIYKRLRSYGLKRGCGRGRGGLNADNHGRRGMNCHSSSSFKDD